jgi:hypothetical protein
MKITNLKPDTVLKPELWSKTMESETYECKFLLQKRQYKFEKWVSASQTHTTAL